MTLILWYRSSPRHQLGTRLCLSTLFAEMKKAPRHVSKIYLNSSEIYLQTGVDEAVSTFSGSTWTDKKLIRNFYLQTGVDEAISTYFKDLPELTKNSSGFLLADGSRWSSFDIFQRSWSTSELTKYSSEFHLQTGVDKADRTRSRTTIQQLVVLETSPDSYLWRRTYLPQSTFEVW